MLDFMGFLNENVSLTEEQKQTMLADFCEAHGYNEATPVTKRVFANQEFVTFIRGSVHMIRERRAQEAITYEELVI